MSRFGGAFLFETKGENYAFDSILGLGFIGDIVAWALWLACVKMKNKGA